MRLITLAFLGLAPTAAAGEKVAFLGITLLDDSLQSAMLGADPTEAARLALIETLVQERFAAEGFDMVDTAPVRRDLERIVNPAKCNGCDTRLAARLGADMALVGEVQKVSNLILTMNLQLRDAETGAMLRGAVVDIRSNTDESWQRGMRYILDNRIFREEVK